MMISAAEQGSKIKVTTGICRVCAQDAPAWYEECSDGIYLFADCYEHGVTSEIVERDLEFFLWGYEQEYKRTYSHLAIPITYRCNLKCKYCYTMSNTSMPVPTDKSLETMKQLFDAFKGNVTLIGGEPTVRKDLFDIIELAKEHPNVNKLSLATNGQRLKDKVYVKSLMSAGIDFVFLSFNDMEYDASKHVTNNKREALQNCSDINIPVWLQGTFTRANQLDSFVEAVRVYRKTIFQTTMRTVKFVGISNSEENFFVSDILRHLGKENECKKGTSPFNRYIKLEGTKSKICSWVLDMQRLDSIDSNYVIADNSITTFHRGMIEDEVLFKNNISAAAKAV